MAALADGLDFLSDLLSDLTSGDQTDMLRIFDQQGLWNVMWNTVFLDLVSAGLVYCVCRATWRAEHIWVLNSLLIVSSHYYART